LIELSITEKREEIIDKIQENLSVVAGGHPMLELGEIFEELASCFQALGSCNLLLYMDQDRFYGNLIYSGFTRRYFIKRSQIEENRSDEHLAISRNESFFDVIAAGSFGLAREIVELSPKHWISDGEYEDDFAYYYFFHNYIQEFENSDKAKLNDILSQFEKSLEDDSSRRFNICKAFFNLEQECFQEEFNELITEREAAKEREKPLLEYDITFEPRKNIFVEGLALLNIANKVGFETQKEYQYCPSIARILAKKPLPEDIYIDVDQVIGR